MTISLHKSYKNGATAATGEASAEYCCQWVMLSQDNGHLRPLIPVFWTGDSTISSK
jgi:hypothetical protein